MAFDWRLLAEVARAVIEQAPASAIPEAMYRSAISRLYFGAYGYARTYATSYLGFLPHEASEDHGRVRAHLRNKRRAGDALRLDKLRSWRNLADYDNELPAGFDLPAKALEALELANRIFLSLTPPKKVP